MLKRFYAIFASTFLVFMPLVGHLAQRVDNDFVVLGQVIDSLGKPVEGAIITLDTPPGADITFRTKSSRDGSFTLYDTFVQSLEKRRLYVAGPEPKGAFLLLTPPFAYTPPWFPLREVGHEITSKSGSKIDVGKIAVQIKYSELNIFLRDRNDEPLIKTRDVWSNVRIRILDAQDKIISETSVSKNGIDKAVDLSNSAILVALPEGVWKIEATLSSGISIEGGKLTYRPVGGWIKSQETVRLKAGEPPQSLFLRCYSSECLSRQ